MTIQSGGFCSELKGMEAPGVFLATLIEVGECEDLDPALALPGFVRVCLDPRLKSAICQRLALAVPRRTTPK
jgi:hypothetical protein